MLVDLCSALWVCREDSLLPSPPSIISSVLVLPFAADFHLCFCGAPCRELDEVMERRLEQMEKRLKEHLDRRLDALELKIETLIMNALPQMTTRGCTEVEGAASCRQPEAAAAASH